MTNRIKIYLPVMLLAIIVLVIYSNSLDAPFVFDDHDNITNNQFIKINELSISQLYDAAFKGIHSFRPLVKISFALNYYFSGLDVFSYHVVNILIHFLNGILVLFISFQVFKKALEDDRKDLGTKSEYSAGLMAFMTASIFVAHPVQIQSVTYIVQRMNSMAVIFCLLSLCLFLFGRQNKIEGKSWVYYAGSILSWVAALLCKQTAAILPGIIILFDWYFYNNYDVHWVKQNFKYLASALLIIVVISVFYLGGNPIDRILQDYEFREFTMGERLLTEARVFFYYISLLILPLPSRLSLLPGFSISETLISPYSTLLSVIGLCLILYYAYLNIQKHKIISFCIFWFVLCLVIESTIVGLEIIFEHRLYLPMFGFSILVSYLVFKAVNKNNTLFICSILVAIFLFGSGAYVRNKAWATEITIWHDVISKDPISIRGNYNYAKALQLNGNVDESIKYFREAIRLSPSYIAAHNNLGISLMNKGLYEDALLEFNRFINLDDKNADAYTNYGVALEALGRDDEALQFYQKAYAINENHAKAIYSMATLLQSKGEAEEAEKFFRQILSLNPEQPMALNNLGVLMIEKGNYNEAIGLLIDAIKFNKDFAFAYFNLGYAQLDAGNLSASCASFRSGLSIQPGNAEIRNEIQARC
ncbi:MAG: tetratricopeptide repeat protein [Gammaproteobacteria bacterium]|jgi:tetratricopeptide (TPR) repeat protein